MLKICLFLAAVLAGVGGPQICRAAEITDTTQGNWTGRWMTSGGGSGKATAQIVSLGSGEYQAAFTAYDGGEQQSETFRFLISGSQVGKKAVFSTQIVLGGKLGTFDWSAEVENGVFKGKFSNKKNYVGTLELKRVETKAEGIGAKPLDGAVVLFDGKNLDGWKLPQEKGVWELRKGALGIIPRSDPTAPVGRHLASKEHFNSAQIHVEYRTPLLPELRGAERGKSGIFLQGRYEVQIVDSFGQPRTLNNFGEVADSDSAGAIFKYHAPKENKTLPPGEWQSLDITFVPPKLNAVGEVETPAEITVVHNGTTIHERVKVHKPTQGAPIKDFTTPAGLILEDAGQGVEFRNIWMVRLDPAK